MLLWQRYFYKQYVLSILYILFASFGLFLLVDAMAHLDNIVARPDFSMWSTYYLASFSKRLDVLLAFAILIATIRTITNFQARGELVALLASGTSKKQLLGPFIITAAIFAFLLLCNYQWVFPTAVRTTGMFETTKFLKEKEKEKESPKEVMLADGTKIIYSSYDETSRKFKDLFWIFSANKIFYMKTLSLEGKTPIGAWVDHILRMPSGQLEKISSFEKYEFKKMHFDERILKNSTTPCKEQSLSDLADESWLYLSSSSPRASEIKSFFIYRLTFPLLCLLACFAPAPFCLRFSRNVPVVLIYLLSLAGLFCVMLILQAAFVLAKYQALSPISALLLPWIAAMGFFAKKFATL
jgi:lipopolysaccharide export system permease protein